MTLVEITTDSGLKGYGEGKAAVGSSGSGASIVTTVEQELRPILLGQDPKNISRLWEMMYNGTRDHYAISRGRGFPVLGRRGLTISAISGVDIALWDIAGQVHETPVMNLLGGAVRDYMPAYASGGWESVRGIGKQLNGYASKGFGAVKMRVGVMDGSVRNSVARVRAARKALGPNIKIMVDAHGTFSVPEAKQFCRGIEDLDIYWFEEPVNSDNRIGTSEVRASTSIPIAAGESEFTRFDMRDLIDCRAVDVLQPDPAIVGGITETMRIAALAHTYQLELAPHLWGSAVSFMAGLNIAFASPSATILEYSLGDNPMLRKLVKQKISARKDGRFPAPRKPGLGIEIDQEFVKKYTVKSD